MGLASIQSQIKSLELQVQLLKAKPYQIRQFLQIVERYNLQLGDEQ
jgi:hypothetical protein